MAQLAVHNRHGGTVFTYPELLAERARIRREREMAEEREQRERERRYKAWERGVA